MRVELTGTTAGRVDAALVEARRRGGGSALGLVLTLVVVTDEDRTDAAVDAATQTAGEHPSRILVVMGRPDSPDVRLDAEVCMGADRGPAETVYLHLHGELAQHPDSVVVPLLVPDSPVVVYWPADAPENLATDPLGRVAQRRITDLATSPRPMEGLRTRARHYAPGDTDLSWTRLTLWRSLLAAALDQPHAQVTRGLVAGEPDSPSAELLALWLEDRLGIPIDRETSSGPGITETRLCTADGDIALVRKDGRLAMLSSPGWPERPIALKRRDLPELMAEELRRLDPDDVYAATLARARGGTAGAGG
jgi:glucose-6-phosphate dehydrogenase assembly protein OpcA